MRSDQDVVPTPGLGDLAEHGRGPETPKSLVSVPQTLHKKSSIITDSRNIKPYKSNKVQRNRCWMPLMHRTSHNKPNNHIAAQNEQAQVNLHKAQYRSPRDAFQATASEWRPSGARKSEMALSPMHVSYARSFLTLIRVSIFGHGK